MKVDPLFDKGEHPHSWKRAAKTQEALTPAPGLIYFYIHLAEDITLCRVQKVVRSAHNVPQCTK